MIEDERDRSVIEYNEGWREWCYRIRPFRFDSDWDVRIIPPIWWGYNKIYNHKR